jgi:uncharacterized protein YqjF (DUF2071 family)
MTDTRERAENETTASVLRGHDAPPPVDRPMFLADWERAVFLHYAIDPDVLQPHVPLPLDLHDGLAYVSIVAFTQRNLRPRIGGRITALLSAPLAEHEFLNLRTYVTHNGIRAIYFLAEWIPNRLALAIGPRMYGLPFRLARNRYAHRHESGDLAGDVRAATGSFRYHAAVDPCEAFTHTEPGSLGAFLLERYAAYTMRDGKLRMFRIWHKPWPQVSIDAVVTRDSLTRRAASWFHDCELVTANYSPGVCDVRIGRPELVQSTARRTPRRAGWLVLTGLIALSTLAGRLLPPWAFMWMLAFCIWAGCKWMTFRSAQPQRSDGTWRRIAYLLAWPGMDAAAFLDVTKLPARPPAREWIAAIGKLIVGITLLFCIARMFAVHPLAAGWIGMIGTILALHFGLFHLLSLAWRRARVDAQPLMNAPLLATSLADFWGRRWNAGFHILAREHVFVPMRRIVGPAGALLATFLVSGLIHDAVISLPASAGFGLPTAYFLLQGVGILLERRFRLRSRLFTLTLVAAPAFWLFHQWFVTEVFVPFMRAIGALGKEF